MRLLLAPALAECSPGAKNLSDNKPCAATHQKHCFEHVVLNKDKETARARFPVRLVAVLPPSTTLENQQIEQYLECNDKKLERFQSFCKLGVGVCEAEIAKVEDPNLLEDGNQAKTFAWTFSTLYTEPSNF